MISDLSLKLKAKNVKLVAFDVDGVMTDGSLSYLENGEEFKTFNAKDGQGIVMLNKAGFLTAIITAKDSGAVRKRASVLGITKLYCGVKNKSKALDELKTIYNLSDNQIAYMGDDYPDLCVIKRVALSCAPKDAIDEVKERVSFVSEFNGGKGAVREFCDFILRSNSIAYDDLVK